MGIASRKAMGVATVALAAALSLSACGSDETPSPTTTAASLPAEASERLAKRSEEVAEKLESGDTCGAAHKADELDAAVAEAEIPAELRSEIQDATQQLVNSVNCPPPREPEEDEKKKKKEEKEDGRDESSHDEDSTPGPPGHGGDLPPGQEKKYEDAELIGP
jgi:hypothetical protein